MAGDKSRDQYSGFLITDPRFTTRSALWSAQSSYTENGPRPGVPEPQDDTDMTLQSGGTQAAGGAMRIKCTHGGFPQPPDSYENVSGAKFVWKNSGDALYRGNNFPNVITRWESLDYQGGATVTAAYTNPAIVTTADDTVIQAWMKNPSSGNDTIVVYRRALGATSWTGPTTVYDSGGTTGDPLFPALLVLPSGRVLLFHWVPGATESQIRMHFSDDSGATWTTGARACLQTPLDTTNAGYDGSGASTGAGVAGYDVGRIAAGYLDGNISIIGETKAHNTSLAYEDIFTQWASSDLGCTLSLIGTWTGATGSNTTNGAYPSIVSLRGQLFLIYVPIAKLTPHVIAIGSAYDAFAGGTELTITGFASGTTGNISNGTTGITDGKLTAWSDSHGYVWLAARMEGTSGVSGAGECVTAVSTDGCETFNTFGASGYSSAIATWFDSGDAATHLREIAGTHQGGRAVIAHNYSANPGTGDTSPCVLQLGGYSTFTQPNKQSGSREIDTQTTWQATWLPFDLPSNCGWTASSGGATHALTRDSSTGTGSARITSTSGQSLFYYLAPSTTNAQGIMVRASFRVTAGGSLSGASAGMTLQLADGTNDYRVEIYADTSAFKLRDIHGSATIGAATTVDMTTGIDLIVVMNTGNIRTWYRLRSESNDHQFLEGPKSLNLTNETSSPAAADYLNFGNTGSTATATSDWYEFHYTVGTHTGFDTTSFPNGGQSNPDDLFAADFSSNQIPLTGGLTFRAVDGPAQTGHSWKIDARADYPIARVFPAAYASPREGWRSVNTAAEQTIALAYNSESMGTGESTTLSDMLGVALLGINFQTATIEGYDVHTTSWVSLATVNAAASMDSIHWARLDTTAKPHASSSSSEPHLFANEMVGGTFDFGSNKLRRITAHSGGKWNHQTYKRPAVILSGIDGTEGTTGTTGKIWSPNVVVLINMLGEKYSAIRLKIPVQNTVDGYFEIGSMVVGPVMIHGTEYSWGRKIRTEPNVSLKYSPDWISRAHRRSVARRKVEFSWADGIDTTTATGEGAGSDYVMGSTSSGAEPLASTADTPFDMEGILSIIDGPRRPIVYLPRVPKSTSSGGDVIVLNRRHDFVYGRMTSATRIDTVQGDEGVDEVIRTGTVTIVEEV